MNEGQDLGIIISENKNRIDARAASLTPCAVVRETWGSGREPGFPAQNNSLIS